MRAKLGNKSWLYGGKGYGNVANVLMANNFDVGCLRPYIEDDGHSYRAVTNESGKVEVFQTNAEATLFYDEWKILDKKIRQVARQRLRAINDIRSRGLDIIIPNGMGKTIYQYQVESDAGSATMSMDGVRRGDRDRPLTDLRGLPLPIIHSDFSFTARELEVARQSGNPLNTRMAEKCTRRVVEEAEKLLIGTSTQRLKSYGGHTIYGYIDFPKRNTYTLTAPTAVGWSPSVFIDELLEMKEMLMEDNQYDDIVVYTSFKWDKYLGIDYSAAKGDNTLRRRALDIQGITDIRTLDYLPRQNWDLVMVCMNSDTVAEVIGMEVTPLQWEMEGGLELYFKIMTIMTPLMYSDFIDQCGILHATSA